MRYTRRSKHSPRTIAVKYAGKCHCCGATINAGEMADYYPVGTIASCSTPVIAHVGGLNGNSARCTSEIGKGAADPGYVDPGELAEDRWNESYR